MPDPPKSSLNVSDVLALLEPEERAQLEVQLGMDSAFEPHSLAGFSAAMLLGAIIELRLPFVAMMRDVTSLLGHLEASIRGNIRFVVLPDSVADLSLDFGPQLRRAIATALSAKLLVDHEKVIGERILGLDREVRSLCNRVKAMPVQRYDEVGRLLKERAKKFGMSPQSVRDEWLAENAFKHTVHEFNPGDHEALRKVADSLAQLERLLTRLATTRPTAGEMVAKPRQALVRTAAVVQTKMNSGPVSHGFPPPRRSVEDRYFLAALKHVDAVKEAVLAASDFCESLDDLYDFLNLEIWRQRWRVYELWVLARCVLVLFKLGAKVSDTTRIVDGTWRLKFTKDSAPVLGLELDGETIDFYYQYFQERNEMGNMPDLAIRLRRRQFVAVIDPKHGYSYSRKDLNDVCERYADAFEPHLSCVCNYFPVRPTEELRQVPQALVLYGLRPEDQEANQTFEQALTSALENAWRDLGRALPRPISLVVLFDGSSSAEHCRADLLARFRIEESALSLRPQPSSSVLIFGVGIVRQGALAELINGHLLEDLPSVGTDFAQAVRAAVDRLDHLPSPKELWIFTDGEGLGETLELTETLNATGTDLLFVEARRSTLMDLASRVGGRHLTI